MIHFGLTPEVCDVIRPRPKVRSAKWACENFVLPPGSEIRGRFRLDLFPHCEEPLDEFDNETIRIITLQWGSRVGKTVFMQACLAKMAATNPNPMAFADADEKSVRRVLRRLWKVLAKVPALADRCPPPRLRAADRIEFPDFLIHGAWSGSPSAAADYAALVVCKNEADKMTPNKSDEADFFELMDERAKGFLRSKIINGSTPAYRGRSRIETARLAGDNRRREVPCLRCGHWQVLTTGNGKKPGGLRWEKLPTGQSSQQLAFETAWYECEKCNGRMASEERMELLNAGVWVREGQSVSGSGLISGMPARPGSHASFGPLGIHYSLLPSVTWGFIARGFLKSRVDLKGRRNYHNSWDALTWDDAPNKLEFEALSAKLCTQDHRGICPSWAAFLTRGVDIQADGHTYWWVVAAWGTGGRCAVVDWGVSTTDDEMRHRIHTDWYPHADSGPSLRPALSLIDSGDGEHTSKVYEFCRRCGTGVQPCKGSSTSAFPGAFRLADIQGDGQKQIELKARLGGLALAHINSELSQWWIENNVSMQGDVDPGGPLGFTLPMEASVDFAFLDQLTNEFPAEVRNERGYEVHSWTKRGKVEFRDGLRYAWAAAQWQTQHGKYWPMIRRNPLPPVVAASRQQPMTTPDGRPYLISER